MAIRNMLPCTVSLVDANEDGKVHISKVYKGCAEDWITTQWSVDTSSKIEDGVAVLSLDLGTTENLPLHGDGEYYIVSKFTLAANPDRTDLLAPAEPITGEDGNIIGYLGLTRNPILAE